MSFHCLNKIIGILLFILGTKILAAPIPPVWSLPAENLNFMGRQQILDEIETRLKNSPLKTIVLSGPSGFGKSQIIKHYAYQHSPEYDIVWWFKGDQYLHPQFKEFALEVGSYMGLNLDEKLKAISDDRLINIIKGTIRKKRLKCLLIFDDAQTYHDIELYIPFSHEKKVHVLITTQNANFSAHGIQVNSFLREESLAYIHRFLPKEEKEAQNNLAKHLGDSPSSVAFAVDYIKNCPGMTIDTYIRKNGTKAPLSPQLLKEAAKRLGGPIDAYDKELLTAIKLNLDELKRNSKEAFQLIEFLSLLNHNEINIIDIESWLKTRGIDKDIVELMYAINKYSFIETTSLKKKKRVRLSMHELIQKIISIFTSLDEKKKLIEECVPILLEAFSGRSDQNAETNLKDMPPLLHATKISEEADRINYHSPALASLRVKSFDVLLCGMRDIDKAKIIDAHLQKDLKEGITLHPRDQILYNIDLSLLSATHFHDYKKALSYGDQASLLLEKEEGMYEEKIRLVANLIQYLSLMGNLDECESLIITGEALLPLSQSAAYNVLFIFATTMYLIDKGELQQTTDLINKNKNLFEKLNNYPTIHFYILNQLAETLLKQGNIKECKKILKRSEKEASGFYADKKNVFFADLDVLKAACSFSNSQKYKDSENLIKQALETYAEVLQGEDKRRNQAFAHLLLGKLYHINKHHDQAKEHYLLSEQIFDKLTSILDKERNMLG